MNKIKSGDLCIRQIRKELGRNKFKPSNDNALDIKIRCLLWSAIEDDLWESL